MVGKCPRSYPVSRPYFCCLYFTANLSQGAGVWRLTRHNLNFLLLKMGVQFHQGCCDQNFTNAEKPEHENPEQ